MAVSSRLGLGISAGVAMRLRGVTLVLGLVVGCNFVTGADDLMIAADDEESEATSASGGAASSGPTTGGASGSTTSTGSGPDTTVGAGGASTTSTGAGADDATTSSSATSSSATGSTGSGAGSTSSSTGGGENCGGAGAGTTPLDAEEQAFLATLNDYRAQNGLGPLSACVSLNRAAQGHSEDMRDNNYFDHTGLNGSSPWDRACDACFDLGCGPSTAMAENIAAGNSGAAGTFTQWRNSPGHNTNMLGSSFTMIGIGRATGGGTYGTYWTTVFAGNQEPSCF